MKSLCRSVYLDLPGYFSAFRVRCDGVAGSNQYLRFALGLMCALATGPAALAQVPEAVTPVTADTTVQQLQTLTGRPTGSADRPRERQPVTFAASDSLRIILAADSAEVAAGDPATRDVATLYGSATVSYDETTLTAGRIDLYLSENILRGRSRVGLAGDGERPAFTSGGESFTARELMFNLETERGRIVEARTAVDDGFLSGAIVKQASPRITFAQYAEYTTCDNPTHAHYYLRSDRMKVVDGKWVYSGPVQLHILGIPTPLWLPFGFFPAAEGRRSGPLPPTYANNVQLGFGLRNLGYYWAVNDFMDAQARFGVYTTGSYEGSGLYRYVRRYGFSGELGLDFARSRIGERTDRDFRVQQDVRLRWQHRQTIGTTASLSGNVNLVSAGALRNVSDSFDDRVAQTTTSAVTFQQRWAGGQRTLSANLSANQQLTTGAASLTLPNVSFSQQRIYPFRGSIVRPQRPWYEEINLSYSGSLRNQYQYRPLPDTVRAQRGAQDVSWLGALFSGDRFTAATGEDQRFNVNATHQVPIAATFTFNRFLGSAMRLNVTPNARYTEDWYSRSQRRELNPETGAVITRQEDGFVSIRRVALQGTANTEFYGTFPLRVGSFEGLRHSVRPSLSFAYEPSYSGGLFNYFRTVTDTSGNVIEYPIISGISPGGQQTLNLSINNVLQTRRVQTLEDGTEVRNPLQLLTFNVASAYNFAADSLNLSPFNFNARSQFGELGFNMNAQFSPYALGPFGQPIRELHVTQGTFPLRLTGFNFSAQTTFRSRQLTTGDRRSGGPPIATPGRAPMDLGLENPFAPVFFDNQFGYVDFDIPWSLSLDFNLGVSTGLLTSRTATLSVSNLDVSLTPNWKVIGRTGYDFASGDLTSTQIAVRRDLHCWEMQFNWIPFGFGRSFSFSIYVKSGRLSDILRLDFPQTDFRSPFGSGAFNPVTL